MTDIAPIPNPHQTAMTEANLIGWLRSHSEGEENPVVIPDKEPTDVMWPVQSADDASAVVAQLAMREQRIYTIKKMAEEMVKREEAEITRLHYAVGGYVRKFADKTVEHWGTLQDWAEQNRGKTKHVKLPFGKLQFRAVAAAYRIPDEKVDAFVAWCNRTGNTHLYRLETSVRMPQLKEYMEQAEGGKREIPCDEQGVLLVEVLPAGRYESFSVSTEVGP